MDKELRIIPLTFEKMDSIDITDTRFTRVKIKLMHLGLNLNNSIFTKEVVNAAIPTLYNTPILGFVEKDKNEEKDFSDHRTILTINKNKIDVIYKGSSYGVIPESCNPRYEKEICSDGIEREYLVVDGLVWNKIEDSDIFIRDGAKKESMELDENSLAGEFDKEGHYVFTSIKFYGACALGDNTTPAMIGATIDTNFALDEIKTKLEQYNTYFTKQSQTPIGDDINNETKGGNMLTTELIDGIFGEFSLTKEEVNYEITDATTEDMLREHLTEFSCQKKEKAFESILNEFSITSDELGEYDSNITEADFRTLVSEFAETKNQSNDPKPEASPKASFSTYNEKHELLRGALKRKEQRNEEGNVEYVLDFYVSDFDESFVYVEKEEYNENTWTYSKGRFAYTITDNIVTITSEFEPMVANKWLTLEESAKIEEARSTFESQTAELERLKQFEKDTLDAKFKESVNAVFSKFDTELVNTTEYDVFKANYNDMSLDQIEEKCFALLGKKNAKFSANNPVPTVVNLGLGNEHEEEVDDGYGGILSKKYNN